MIEVPIEETWRDLPRPVTAKRLGKHLGETVTLVPGIHEVGPAGGNDYEVRVKSGNDHESKVEFGQREVVLIPELNENELLPIRENQ